MTDHGNRFFRPTETEAGCVNSGALSREHGPIHAQTIMQRIVSSSANLGFFPFSLELMNAATTTLAPRNATGRSVCFTLFAKLFAFAAVGSAHGTQRAAGRLAEMSAPRCSLLDSTKDLTGRNFTKQDTIKVQGVKKTSSGRGRSRKTRQVSWSTTRRTQPRRFEATRSWAYENETRRC